MQYKVLALDLDGTLTNNAKVITPRTKAALQAAADRGVRIVLASGRPTVGIEPLAKELELDRRGGCILSYNGGKIIDCKTGETLVQHEFPPELIDPVCTFARYWMHNGFINVDNQKMSKSLHNFFTVRDVANLYGYEPIRYFMLTAGYQIGRAHV